MIEITLFLMKVLRCWIGFKKAIAKIRKRTTFGKQPLDNKLFLRCYNFKFIFIANNAHISLIHVVYLLFMLPFRMTANHVCSVLLFLPLAG